MSLHTKETLIEQIREWEFTRQKGRKKYVINHWVIPLGVVLPLFHIKIAFLFSLIAGINPKSWCIFILIFGPAFILLSAAAGRNSWNYYEKRWQRWQQERLSGPINLPGTRKPFKKYIQLMVGVYSIPIWVLNVFFFLLAIFLANFFPVIETNFGIYFISFLIIFALSSATLFNVMFFIKNPICAHGILSSPQQHQHPEAKGTYWHNAWRIFRGRPFVCLDCADRYIFENNGNGLVIIKLEKNITTF